MFVAETAIVATMLCSSAKRRRCGDGQDVLSVSTSKISSLVVSSGRTLERQMTNDIGALAGVVGVKVNRTDDTFEVLVIMENMDFAPFDAVIRKKVELYDRYPDLTFNFEVMPIDAVEGDLVLPLHAA